MLGKVPLYIRTASYLTTEQLLYRIWYDVRRRSLLFRPVHSRSSNDTLRWRPLKTTVPFLSSSVFDTSDILKGRFRFLNNTADLGKNPDWTADGEDRLWRYNLHYFSYLMADGGLHEQSARHLIEHWIAENPPGTRDAWDPFPISLRLVNWIKYFSATPSTSSWAERPIRSACVQASWLENHLEYHLLGNHLFKNAKALMLAGFFCPGADGKRWLETGLKILRQELNEQILADGGHFERSPMYHSMILEDCLDLLNVLAGIKAGDGPVGETGPHLHDMTATLEAAASRMAVFLQGMVHPDRHISLFNDAALRIEQDPDRLLSYYEAVTGRKLENPDRELWAFPQSGYFVMSPRSRDRLIADCGLIGPDYQPGHAHCDLLSFELSLNGRRVIVDSGCAQYEEGEIRKYNRGNMGHNTVSIDGCDQSEVWGAHRCARRARPLYAKLSKSDDSALVFEGAHDGYRRLPGSPIHHRSIRWSGDEILIGDCVDGRGTHSIESRLHVHPDLAVLPREGAVLICDESEELVEVSHFWGAEIESTEGWYCPEFGIQRKCSVLRVLERRARLPYSACWRLRIVNGEQ